MISFVKLIGALPSDLKSKLGFLKLKAGELEKFWNQWRNSLAHLTVAAGSTLALKHPENKKYVYKRTLELLKENRGREVTNECESFFREEDDPRWCCRIDYLVCDVRSIAEWLASKVDEFPDERIKETLDWHEDDLNRA